MVVQFDWPAQDEVPLRGLQGALRIFGVEVDKAVRRIAAGERINGHVQAVQVQ